MSTRQPDAESDGQAAGSSARDLLEDVIAHELAESDVLTLLQGLGSDGRDQQARRLAGTLHRSAALLEVARRMSESLSVELLVGELTALTCRFLGTERCTVFLHEAATNELRAFAARDEQVQSLRIAVDSGIAGSVFSSGEPVVIADAQSDPRFNPDVDRKTGFVTHDMLCAPIWRPHGNREAMGVIQVLNVARGEFAPRDIEFLEAIAAQAAPSLANAQLHAEMTRTREEQHRLIDLTRAISSELQLRPLLHKIMAAASDFLEADKATLFLHDPRTKELWAAASLDAAISDVRFPDDCGIAGSVFQDGQPVNLADARSDSRFNPEVDRETGYYTKSLLCMPVESRTGSRIAVVQVLNKTGGPFVKRDEDRLHAFCAQAAIAIENARLFDEVVQVKNYNESVLQSMRDGVLTVDRSGVIETTNAAVRKFLRAHGLDGEVAGQSANDLFGHENEWIQEAIARVEATGEPEIAIDTELAAPDGERVSVNLTVAPLHDAKHRHLGCLLHVEDLTREKRLRSTMARYMPKPVADRLLEEGQVALGGKLQKASVLFSDIRRFTTITEDLGPQETVSLLNDYFGIMVDRVLDNEGLLDKFVGDALMGVFGVPFNTPEDADHAACAAVEMLRALRAFNEERRARGAADIDVGIGIATDEVVSGNIGSLKRMDYTVIGDGVNLASRLEGATKAYGVDLLLSDRTVAELSRPWLLREVDILRVKGKDQPVRIHEVLDHVDADDQERVRAMLPHHAEGLELYRSRRWDAAAACFTRALDERPGDPVSAIHRERCSQFASEPPPDDWTGTHVMQTK